MQRMRSSQGAKRADSNPYAAVRRTDSAEISQEARLAAAARDISPVRMDKVDALREKLRDPGYNIDAHFRAAMNLLISEDL
jgi:anti-sigma28 factor (negative regulator of flagellin synthesis)